MPLALSTSQHQAYGQATPAAPPSGEPVLIGCPFNLTGAFEIVDTAARDGAMLAAQELNTVGGILGRPVRLIVYDGQSELEETATVTRRLIEEDQVTALVGLTDTEIFLAAGPIAQEAGTPFLDVGGTGSVIAEIGDYIYMVPYSDVTEGSVAAEYCHSRGWTTAVVFYDESKSAKSLREQFESRLTADDAGQVLNSYSVGGDQPDLTDQLAEIIKLETPPGSFFISANANLAGQVVAQLRTAGLTQPIVGGDGFDSPLFLQHAGQMADGVTFTTHEGVYGEAPATLAFRDAFQAMYAVPPSTAFAALGYDGIRLVADAINRAGSLERKAVRDALNFTLDFAGVTGPISYSAERHIPAKPVALVQVQEGSFVQIASATPQQVPEED